MFTLFFFAVLVENFEFADFFPKQKYTDWILGLPYNNSWYCRLTFAACAALKWVADVSKQSAAAFK